MNTWRHIISAALPIAAGSLILCSCRTADRMPAPDRVGDFNGLSKLYREAAAPHRRTFRRPVRDARREAMRLLADKAGRMADQTGTPPVTPAVTDSSPAASAKEQVAAGGLRDSLRDLETAARRGNVSAVRTAYVHAAHRYRLLEDAGATLPTHR